MDAFDAFELARGITGISTKTAANLRT